MDWRLMVARRIVRQFAKSAALVIAAFALVATVWQARIALDTERQTLRAYVFVDKSTLSDFDTPTYTVRIEIKNSGLTPAYHVVHWMGTGIAEFPSPKDGFPPPPVKEWKSIDTMAAQAVSEVVASSAFKEGNTTTIAMGVAALWVFGRIDYEDVFKRKCWTTYRFYVGGDVGLNGSRLASAKEGNDADRNCNSWFDW